MTCDPSPNVSMTSRKYAALTDSFRCEASGPGVPGFTGSIKVTSWPSLMKPSTYCKTAQDAPP